jgi:hypothetical protein
MPNHVHGTVVLVGAQFPRRTGIAPNNVAASGQGAINRAPTLGEILRAFKAAAARRIRPSGRPDFRWQRDYRERVIRNEDELNRIREHILPNPSLWEWDRENPHAGPCRGGESRTAPTGDIERIFGGVRP